MTDHLPSMPPVPAIRRKLRLLSSRAARPSRSTRTPAGAALFTLLLLALPTPALASGQLELIPDPVPLAILVVVFGALIVPVNSLIFKPILKALEEREARIQGARERSDYLQREANSVLARYETSIREAHDDAARSRRVQLDGAKSEQAEITSAARSEAERRLEVARNELKASFEEARGSLRSQAQELAREAAASVLGRPL